jgi:hypothetical protein
MQSEDAARGGSGGGPDTGGKTKYERSKNAEFATVQSWQPGSNVTSRRRSHSAKQRSEMTLIDEGKQIDRSDPQSANADSPRTETRDPASNVTFTRKEEHLKHSLAIVSTDAGMQIDVSPQERKKTDSPSTEIRVPASNVTSDSFMHPRKQDLQSV